METANNLKLFFQESFYYDQEIGKINPTGLICDGVIDFPSFSNMIKNIDQNAKTIQMTKFLAFISLNIETNRFFRDIKNNFIYNYKFFSFFVNDSISLHAIHKFQKHPLRIVYKNHNIKYGDNIFYFSFKFNDDINKIIEKLENKRKIIEISIINLHPDSFFVSFQTFSDLISVYIEIIQNKIWPIFVFPPQMSNLIHKEVIIQKNIQLSRNSPQKFPLFQSEKYLFYIGFIESTPKKHQRIKNCSKLYDINDISDVQISCIYDENENSIRKSESIQSKNFLFKTVRTFLGFDSQFKCLHVYDYLIEKNTNTNSIFDVILINFDDSFLNCKIKHNLFYLEVPNIYFNLGQSKEHKTIDPSILYSIDFLDCFNDSQNCSSFLSFKTEKDLIEAKQLFSSLKRSRKINRIRMIEPADYLDFFGQENSNKLLNLNLSILIFQLKSSKDDKELKEFQIKSASKIFNDILCLKDNRLYCIIGMKSNEERDKVYCSLKKSKYSKVIKSYYPETIQKPKNHSAQKKTIKYTPIIPSNSTNSHASEFAPIDQMNRTKSGDSEKLEKYSSKILEFTPKKGYTYFYVEEIEATRPSSSTETRNTTLYGIQNIDDLQRSFYLPDSDRVCTFFGFLDRKQAEFAIGNRNLKKTKSRGAYFFYEKTKSTNLSESSSELNTSQEYESESEKSMQIPDFKSKTTNSSSSSIKIDNKSTKENEKTINKQSNVSPNKSTDLSSSSSSQISDFKPRTADLSSTSSQMSDFKPRTADLSSTTSSSQISDFKPRTTSSPLSSSNVDKKSTKESATEKESIINKQSEISSNKKSESSTQIPDFKPRTTDLPSSANIDNKLTKGSQNSQLSAEKESLIKRKSKFSPSKKLISDSSSQISDFKPRAKNSPLPTANVDDESTKSTPSTNESQSSQLFSQNQKTETELRAFDFKPRTTDLSSSQIQDFKPKTTNLSSSENIDNKPTKSLKNLQSTTDKESIKSGQSKILPDTKLESSSSHSTKLVNEFKPRSTNLQSSENIDTRLTKELQNTHSTTEKQESTQIADFEPTKTNSSSSLENDENNTIKESIKTDTELASSNSELNASNPVLPNNFSQLLSEESNKSSSTNSKKETSAPLPNNFSQLLSKESNKQTVTSSDSSVKNPVEQQRNPNIKEFIPIPNLHYIYIEESTTKESQPQSSHAYIFGLLDIDDLQRFYYFPKTNRVCTFMGFADLAKAEDAKQNPNFKSTKTNGAITYKSPIVVEKATTNSQLKIFQPNPSQPKPKPPPPPPQNTTPVIQPKTTEPIQTNFVIQKKSTNTNTNDNKQTLQTEIKRPQKNTSINIDLPKPKPKEKIEKEQKESVKNSLSSSSSSSFSPKPLHSSSSQPQKKSPEISIQPPSKSSLSIPLKTTSSSSSTLKQVKEFEVKKSSNVIQRNISSSTSINSDNEKEVENAPYFQPQRGLLYFYFAEATKNSLISGKNQQNNLFGVYNQDTQRYVKHPTKNNGILYTFFGFENNEDREKGIQKVGSLGIRMKEPISKYETEEFTNEQTIIHIKPHSPANIPQNSHVAELFDLSISKEMREKISEEISENDLNIESQTGVINTKDQNMIEAFYSTQNKDTINKINSIIKHVICEDFNVRQLEMKTDQYFYFDESFIPKNMIKQFIFYLKTVPGVSNIQRNVFWKNKIATFFFYQKVSSEKIINSIKDFLLKNDLLFDKKKCFLKNTIVLNEDLILQNKEDFDTIVNEIRKIQIKTIKIERGKLFVYQSHQMHKLFQKFTFICFLNEKDKNTALNHLNQIAFGERKETLQLNTNLHYAKIQNLSFSRQQRGILKSLYSKIPDLEVINKNCLSIENSIEATYLGFKSIRSLNFGMALLLSRLILQSNNQNQLTFFTPVKNVKYIRLQHEFFEEIYNKPNSLSFDLNLLQKGCQEMDEGVLKSFDYIGYNDFDKYNNDAKKLFNMQLINHYIKYTLIDNDDINDEENEKLIDIDEICFFGGMF